MMTDSKRELIRYMTDIHHICHRGGHGSGDVDNMWFKWWYKTSGRLKGGKYIKNLHNIKKDLLECCLGGGKISSHDQEIVGEFFKRLNSEIDRVSFDWPKGAKDDSRRK